MIEMYGVLLLFYNQCGGKIKIVCKKKKRCQFLGHNRPPRLSISDSSPISDSSRVIACLCTCQMDQGSKLVTGSFVRQMLRLEGRPLVETLQENEQKRIAYWPSMGLKKRTGSRNLEWRGLSTDLPFWQRRGCTGYPAAAPPPLCQHCPKTAHLEMTRKGGGEGQMRNQIHSHE